MKKVSTWRFVLKIVGAALAVAGAVCLVIAFWDKLSACARSVCAKCRKSESYDYEEDLFYKEL